MLKLWEHILLLLSARTNQRLLEWNDSCPCNNPENIDIGLFNCVVDYCPVKMALNSSTYSIPYIIEKFWKLSAIGKATENGHRNIDFMQIDHASLPMCVYSLLLRSKMITIPFITVKVEIGSHNRCWVWLKWSLPQVCCLAVIIEINN